MKIIFLLFSILISVTFFSQSEDYNKNQLSFNIFDISKSRTSIAYERFLNKKISVKIPIIFTSNKDFEIKYLSSGLDAYYHFSNERKTNLMTGISLRAERRVNESHRHLFNDVNLDSLSLSSEVYQRSYSYERRKIAMINLGIEHRMTDNLYLSAIVGYGLGFAKHSYYGNLTYINANGELNLSYRF